ncbi:XRE family transcriptional regulator [Nostoc linckia z18]|uniref:XRE family transcriptional regulator n=2 Tax=Nostoc linckia TaxID=92942 RepID=A0A9Q6ENK5_NOSLI|nr:helix-turn-helix domain-containing protein [Nostoc linckia]PHK35392.1 XRE family transcriptional regulator [Nostoc linckia z15]PHK45974.1 XRE family transcriptional regulator [Nostoc linckia z16]PHJ67988.1 XRE family transcriptional regulator [Nostoc linckia z1]PHJ72926.1 XRE family transcriptional regulator [Nostoc linckia z3]PHJ77418.1 XRE family transcriptional regulator [Nostoc linckia z2]
MKKPNFQAWLQQKVSDDPEVILAGKLEYLRLYLTDAMREIRNKAGLTQTQLAEKLGVKQAAVSKLESALKEHELESVLHYLHALGADLLVAVKQGDDLYQASDNDGLLLVDVPDVVFQKALAANMSVREYVRLAVEKFSTEDDGLRTALVKLLESDDAVAVKVRQRLGSRTIQEVAVDLEKCLSLSEEEDRIFAVKNVLAANVLCGESNRGTSDEIDEIELLDLAEELLEKLADI